MFSIFVLLLAVSTRILPHALHQVGWNFSLLGASLLFLGSQMSSDSPRRAAAKLAGILAVLVATDYYLTIYAYGFSFHVSGYLITWLWYAGVCAVSMGWLRRITAIRVGVAAIAAPTSFFLVSNFAVWASGSMYAHTVSGLVQCYAMGIPFYRNDLVTTVVGAGAVFALPVLAGHIAESLRPAGNDLPA